MRLQNEHTKVWDPWHSTVENESTIAEPSALIVKSNYFWARLLLQVA